MQQSVQPAPLTPADLADIKTLHEIPFPWSDVFLIAGICAAVALTAVLLYFRFKRRSVDIESAAVPVHEHWGVMLKQRLNALPAAAPVSFDEWRRVYFELASLWRELLERILEIPITERTVQEILELIKGRFSIEQELQIRAFWMRAEALLFARVLCAPEDYAEDLRFARDLFVRALARERASEQKQSEEKVPELTERQGVKDLP